MTEADYIGTISYMGELILISLSTAIGFVFAYMAGLHYFLRKAPVPMKAGAFLAFCILFGVLMAYAAEYYEIAEASRLALDQLAHHGTQLSPTGAVLAHHTGEMGEDDWIGLAVAILSVATVALLGYLTFVYDWPDWD